MQKSAVGQLSGYLAGQGLRSTSQRDAILKTSVEAGQHLISEVLSVRVKKTLPGIGYATIYRIPHVKAAG
jgi:Fur family ferric uptake transcriptional regulator